MSRGCRTEMKGILSKHVDGNLAVSTDDLFAQQPLDEARTFPS